MSAFPNPRYDPSRRRRRHNGPGASHHSSPLTTIATAAAVAYGAYQLGSWAWNSYFGDNEDEEHEEGNNKEENASEDLLYEWIGDVRTVERDIRKEEGFDSDDLPSFCSDEIDDDDIVAGEGCESNNGPVRRSRRSRSDWGGDNGRHNKARSRRPSPPQDFHRHTTSHEQIVEGEDESKSNENNGGGIGLAKNNNLGMKGAAAHTMASAGLGLGGAVTAGISAGIQAFNQKSIPGSNENANNSGDSSIISEQERRLRMGRCRLETSRAMMDFLPTLRKAIAKETDVSVETEGLKKLRTRKKDMLEIEANNQEEEQDVIREEERKLWNIVKCKSVTRLIATVYAHTIVFLVLTVQVNLLGGKLLRDEQELLQKSESMNNSTSTSTSAAATSTDQYRKSHQLVLAKTYHHLFSKGIPSLVESVGKEVSRILQLWDVVSGDVVTNRDVSTWMTDLRDEMEQRNQQQKEEDDGVSHFLAKFVIPAEEEEGNNVEIDDDDELAKYILDETYDLLESPIFANAERYCLDATFDHLRTKVFGKLFLMDDQIPLANVVTHFQKTAVSTFHKPPSHKDEMKNWGGVLGMMEEPLPSVPNDYILKLERLDAVQELGDVCF